MKKLLVFLCAMSLVFGLAGVAGAILTDNSDGTITDDDRGDGTALMWLQSPGPDQNFSDALTWADTLVFAGYDNWRLPSALDFSTGLPDEGWNSMSNEFGHLYGDELNNPANLGDVEPFIDMGTLWYWTGTVDPDSSGDAFAFFWSFDGQWLNQSSADRADMTTSTLLHVTAVRDIVDGNDIAPVPEPATMLLLGTGLIGLAGATRRRFKK